LTKLSPKFGTTVFFGTQGSFDNGKGYAIDAI